MTVIISGDNGVSDVDGSAGTPAIRGTDANTGIFFGSDIIGFSEGGTECARFNADAQFVAAAGTASLPVITTTGDTNTGIFFPAADTIAFAEGGAEAMRIDTSGNVGIGTSSPGYRLEVKGPSATAGQLSIHDGTGDTTVSGNNAASLLFQARDTSVRTIAEIDAVNTTTNGTGGAMVFQTRISDTLAERMRIDSSGNFLVGKTTSSSTTQGNAIGPVLANFIASTASPSDGPQIQIGNIAASVVSGYRYISFRVNAGGTEVGSITTNGTSSTAYGTSSDYRLKENIAPMTGALAKVAALKPCTYTWKSNGSAGEGFIAHELQTVVPDAVIGEKDAVNEDGSIKPQNIDTSFLVATLTAAIQELKAINDAQASRIETLEAKVAALEAK